MAEPSGKQKGYDPDRLAELFAAASEIGSDARTGLIERECAGDEELARTLRELLEIHDSSQNAGTELPGLERERLADLLDDEMSATAVPLVRAGPFRILDELGHGGMGTVYLAERVEGGFEQKVALKLVRGGMTSDSVQRRFLLERQVLARLEHPNIARLLQGGITGEGHPYFAMELVDGRPLTEYCDAERLGVEERLRLICTVCEAVHFAHSKLVIHRDLKPSNVFVDGTGTVKLLDFGIARLLASDDVSESEQSRPGSITAQGHLPFTPDYAAPEQFAGEEVSTSTDVYSLGVLLHEVLTGLRPYSDRPRGSRFQHPSSTTGPPTRPSGLDLTSTADSRGFVLKSLKRRLRGDLDAIVLKALEPRPKDRYESMLVLRDDLLRHLEGRPISARQSTASYRVSRFLQRHKVGVAVAGGILLLALFSALAVFESWRRSVEERDRADRVKEFVLELFELGAPNAAQGQSLTVADMIQFGVQRAEQEFASEPLLQSELFAKLGELLQERGDLEAARELLERALSVRGGVAVEEDRVRFLTALGGVEYELADYERAAALHREATQVARRLRSEPALEVRSTLGLSRAVRALARYQEAEGLAREALERYLDADIADSALRAECLLNVGVAVYLQRRYDEAESLYQEALGLQREAFGESHTTVADTLNRLGLLYNRRGDYEAAAESLSASLESYERLLGGDHNLVATVLGNLAASLEGAGRLEDSIPLALRALEIQRRALGSEHPMVATQLVNLAVAYEGLGKNDESLQAAQEALTIYQAIHSEDHPYTAIALSHVARLMQRTPRLEEAAEAALRAYQMRRRLDDTSDMELAQTAYWCALIERKRGNREDSERYFVEAVGRFREVTPLPEPNLVATYIAFAKLRGQQGQTVAGLELLTKARGLMEREPEAFGSLVAAADTVEEFVRTQRG